MSRSWGKGWDETSRNESDHEGMLFPSMLQPPEIGCATHVGQRKFQHSV